LEKEKRRKKDRIWRREGRMMKRRGLVRLRRRERKRIGVFNSR